MIDHLTTEDRMRLLKNKRKAFGEFLIAFSALVLMAALCVLPRFLDAWEIFK